MKSYLSYTNLIKNKNYLYKLINYKRYNNIQKYYIFVKRKNGLV